MKSKRKIILFAIFLFIFALLFLWVGFYFNKLSKSSYIMGTILDEIGDSVHDYIYPTDDVFIGDEFTVDGTMQFDLTSDTYKENVATDEESLKKSHMIHNLDLMQNHFLIKQKPKTQEAYAEFESKIGEENLVHQKVFVQNATEYYYIEDIVKDYINDGTCNYFETINEDVSTKDNMDYLYSFFFESLKDSLKEEYFERYERVEKIRGKEEKTTLIVLRLDDKRIHLILEDVLKSFQTDEKAKKILENYYPDYLKWKISKDKDYLEKEESYTISIYTSHFLNKPLKYEIVHLHGEEKENVIFEGSMDKGEAYYVVNDHVKYQFTCERKENSYNFQIQDALGNFIGEAKFEKDKLSRTINYSFNYENKNYDFIYSSKYSDVKKKKAWKNTKKMSFKFVEDQKNRLSGDVVIQMNAENIAKIEEDISTATLASHLGDEEKQKIDNLWDTIQNRLEK